jgi:hypothetical protein
MKRQIFYNNFAVFHFISLHFAERFYSSPAIRLRQKPRIDGSWRCWRRIRGSTCGASTGTPLDSGP